MTSLFSTKQEFIIPWLMGFYDTSEKAASAIQALNKKRIDDGLTLDHLTQYIGVVGSDLGGYPPMRKQTSIRTGTKRALRRLHNVARVYSGLRSKKTTLLIETAIYGIYPIRVCSMAGTAYIGQPVINDRPDPSRYQRDRLIELDEQQLEAIRLLEGFEAVDKFFDYFNDQDDVFDGYLFALSMEAKNTISAWTKSK